MTKRTRDLGVVICLILAAIVAGCAGDRMSRSTEEAVDDSLLANKVKLALYADKEVSGKQIPKSGKNTANQPRPDKMSRGLKRPMSSRNPMPSRRMNRHMSVMQPRSTRVP